MSVKRNLKEIKTLAKNFTKLQVNDKSIHRDASLYEDMGNILNRYFEINGEIANDQK